MDRKATRDGGRPGRLSGGLGIVRGVCSALAGVALSLGVLMVALPAAATARAEASFVSSDQDRLYMRSGNVIQGEILEETETTIKMRVVVAGISSVTTYQKSDIVRIERAERAETPEVESPDASRERPGSPGTRDRERRSTRASDEGAKIYHVRLHGTFGENFSETVVERLIRDIDTTFDDKYETVSGGRTVRLVDEAVRDRHIVVFELDFGWSRLVQGFDQVFRCEQISPMIEDEIAAGRRVVFWVNRAVQGGAFLPWISPEIYFKSSGVMGGIGGLEDVVSGWDEEVREKQISLRIGHAEGRVIKGGRPEFVPVIRAMLRMDYWLAVKFEGGRPIFLNHEPRPQDGTGWTILSDDGKGKNKDADDSLEGNDILNLDSDWALKLGISRGTVNTMGDLARAIGVGDDYEVLKDARGQRIYNDWGAEVDRAWRMAKWTPRRFDGDRPLGDLFEDLSRVEGNDIRAHGQRIQIYERVVSTLNRYAEFMDRDGGIRAEMRRRIEELREAIRQMRQR